MAWREFAGLTPGPPRTPAVRIRIITFLVMLGGIAALVLQPANGLFVPVGVLVLGVGLIVVFLLPRLPVLRQRIGMAIGGLFILTVATAFLMYHPTPPGPYRIVVSVAFGLFVTPIGAAFLAGMAATDQPRVLMIGKFRLGEPRRTMFLSVGLFGQIAAWGLIAAAFAGQGGLAGGMLFVGLTYGAALVWAIAIPFYLEGRALRST